MGSASTKDEPINEWKCHACTFINKNNGNKCTICFTPKTKQNEEEKCESNKEWQCDICKTTNKLNEHKSCKKCNTKNIIVPIKIEYPFNESFLIYCSYSSHIKIMNLNKKIIHYINKKYYPKKCFIKIISKSSFIDQEVRERWSNSWNDICSKLITNYNENDIITKGMHIHTGIRYEHKINDNVITCEYIKNKNTNQTNQSNDEDNIDPLSCSIYKSMKIDGQFTENALNHLYEYTHFKDEYNEKPKCNHGIQCNSFINLENGGNKLDDRIHIKLYRHPPRYDHHIQLSKNTNSLIINTDKKQNYPIYEPTNEDEQKYKYNKQDGYVNALILEVINNGFKYDLCLKCKPFEDCKCKELSLLSVIDQKLNHIRHQAMGKPLNRGLMLSLILYTGGRCNYDLCATQRSGDYEKWIWFDYCLFNAIKQLSYKEKGYYKIFSGLYNVKLNTKEVELGYFVTYTSATWVKNISLSFIKDNTGMVMKLMKHLEVVHLYIVVMYLGYQNLQMNVKY